MGRARTEQDGPAQLLSSRCGIVTLHCKPWAASCRRQLRQFGLGHPEDVAYLVLFLACDESRFITAQTINVDGGVSGFIRELATYSYLPVSISAKTWAAGYTRPRMGTDAI